MYENSNQLKNLCLCGIFSGVIFAATYFLQIPIPFGYFNPGNGVILYLSLFLPTKYSIAAGCIGSAAAADLVSYPVYILPTLLIKACMTAVFRLMQKPGNTGAAAGMRNAALISMLIPLVGYAAAGGIIYGSAAAGLAQLPGLAAEYICNLILFFALTGSLGKRPPFYSQK